MSDSKHPLVRWRKAKAISQTVLAKDLGVTQPFISKIENGEETVALPLAARIFQKTGVQLGALAEITPKECQIVVRTVAAAPA
jgi:transcriptional regulator with XRE-family HTH domain